MKPVNVGLLGLGTVGAGTINVLANNRAELARRAGREIRIVQAAARDITRERGCDLSQIALTTDLFDIVRNPDVQVVAELIGGTTLARELVLEAIAHGKHIVTANKALIAEHGDEIFAAAQAQGVMVAFEAAVTGGLPMIKTLREGLAANRIERLAGIINGTTNFILSEMRDNGSAFADVLAEAQHLGYAEADPTFDIEGIDAAHKLTILAAIAFGIPLQFDKVYTEGVGVVSSADVAHAERLGYRIKHLGHAVRREAGVELRVHATLIPKQDLLANVEGVLNAVKVNGDAVGETLFCGAGAGAGPTASAVVADLLDVVRTLTADPENRVPHLAFQPDQLADLPILPMREIETAYYLRLNVADEPGVLADVAKILAQHQISIEAVQQHNPGDTTTAEVVIITHRTQEGAMDDALQAIRALATVSGDVTRIRVENP